MSIETLLWGAIFGIIVVGGIGLAASLVVFARSARR